MIQESFLYKLAGGVAVAVWVIPWLLLGGREAWDHWSYFMISLPLMAATAACAAYLIYVRWWRWPLTMLLAQYVAALLLGGFGNLFPLGIIAFAVLSVPMFTTAAIAAWVARRNEQPIA